MSGSRMIGRSGLARLHCGCQDCADTGRGKQEQRRYEDRDWRREADAERDDTTEETA